jgi:hypothetical protein
VQRPLVKTAENKLEIQEMVEKSLKAANIVTVPPDDIY